MNKQLKESEMALEKLCKTTTGKDEAFTNIKV